MGYAYLVYNSHIKDIKSSKLKANEFINKRLDATVDMGLTPEQANMLADKSGVVLENEISKLTEEQLKNIAMVVYIVLLDNKNINNPYRLINEDESFDKSLWGDLGFSLFYPGKRIIVNYDLVAKRIIEAKNLEARSKGSSQQGVCGICGSVDELVSPYCKQWPWLSSTWYCPFPNLSIKNNKAGDLAKTVVAICNECSQALDLGAGIIKRLERQMYYTVIQDIFTMYEGPNAKKSKGKTKEGITGLMFALPILDSTLEKDEAIEKYNIALNKMINDKDYNKSQEVLRDILGFDAILPEELQDDQYRLTVMYYSGDRDKGVIYSRASIEDVVPSLAKKILRIMKRLPITIDTISEAANLSPNVNERAKRSMECLLPILARAYGASLVFSTLNKVLTGKKLDTKRFIIGVSNRMNTIMVANRTDKGFDLLDETLFYLVFREFIRQYQTEVLKECDDMQTWKELDNIYDLQSPRNWEFENVEELGYVCGRLLREFSSYYWGYMNEKRGKSDADFIKDRIMTFGTRLTPEAIWKRGLSMIEDYRLRFELKLSNEYREKVGIVLAEYTRLGNQVEKNRDLFMASFWSGYALGFRKKDKNEINTENVEGVN